MTQAHGLVIGDGAKLSDDRLTFTVQPAPMTRSQHPGTVAPASEPHQMAGAASAGKAASVNRGATGATPRGLKRERARQRLVLLALLAAVIAVDQAAKWWGWRHVPEAHINPGGDFLTGPTVDRWYAEPVTGALLDLLDFGLLSAAVTALARRRRPAFVTVWGTIMIGGWGSNLLDRLGMHYWTAPGSVRGVVDFIPIGTVCYNLADFCILVATPLFLLAAACFANRSATAGAATSARCNRPRARAPMAALVGTGVIFAVALGAAHHGRLTKPRNMASMRSHIATEPRYVLRTPRQSSRHSARQSPRTPEFSRRLASRARGRR